MCAAAAVIGMTVPRVGSGSDSWSRSTAGATAGFAVRRLEFGLVCRLGTIAVVASAIGGSGCTSGGIAGARLTLFISRPETAPFGVRDSCAWSGAPLKLFLTEAGTTRDERVADAARSVAAWEACAPGSDSITIETWEPSSAAAMDSPLPDGRRIGDCSRIDFALFVSRPEGLALAARAVGASATAVALAAGPAALAGLDRAPRNWSSGDPPLCAGGAANAELKKRAVTGWAVGGFGTGASCEMAVCPGSAAGATWGSSTVRNISLSPTRVFDIAIVLGGRTSALAGSPRNGSYSPSVEISTQ